MLCFLYCEACRYRFGHATERLLREAGEQMSAKDAARLEKLARDWKSMRGIRDAWRLVGEAYVEGVMHGQLADEVERDKRFQKNVFLFDQRFHSPVMSAMPYAQAGMLASLHLGQMVFREWLFGEGWISPSAIGSNSCHSRLLIHSSKAWAKVRCTYDASITRFCKVCHHLLPG